MLLRKTDKASNINDLFFGNKTHKRFTDILWTELRMYVCSIHVLHVAEKPQV